ncbi:MAG: winged helix-turn-helix transcriptional regulator [Austwickia sp.]|jgi:ArsR family transcriptional regulator, zinc-responsive transcriptional repressor|nr:winged helix-turn-helix transcriptional regulator [Austwickia sp.]
MSSAPTAPPEWESVSEMFGSLASPLRVGIIALLLERAMSVAELVDALAVTQPLVSHHLRILREHCLVTGERSGRRVVYRLMDDHVGHIVADALKHAEEHAHRDDVPERSAPDPEESP